MVGPPSPSSNPTSCSTSLLGERARAAREHSKRFEQARAQHPPRCAHAGPPAPPRPACPPPRPSAPHKLAPLVLVPAPPPARPPPTRERTHHKCSSTKMPSRPITSKGSSNARLTFTTPHTATCSCVAAGAWVARGWPWRWLVGRGARGARGVHPPPAPTTPPPHHTPISRQGPLRAHDDGIEKGKRKVDCLRYPGPVGSHEDWDEEQKVEARERAHALRGGRCGGGVVGGGACGRGAPHSMRSPQPSLTPSFPIFHPPSNPPAHPCPTNCTHPP